jgi:ribosomal protein L3 glutamine methyltransferase
LSDGKQPATPPAAATLRQMLRFAEQRFETANLSFGHGTANAYDEAAYLMLYALGLPPQELRAHLERKFNATQHALALQLVERRIAERVPAAYLTHEAWLVGHRFYVDERVIVPRSFIAELLAEGLDPWLADPNAVTRVLDMCTGSGCLAILAALAFSHAQVDAVDISTAALHVAKRNVADYGLDKHVHVVKSDLFAGLDRRRYGLIISNPPYVNARAMQKLPAEYRNEPGLALAAGIDGLAIVNRILHEAAKYLEPTGILVVEIGHNRRALEKAYPKLGFTWLEVAAGDQFVFMLTAEQLRGTASEGVMAPKSV